MNDKFISQQKGAIFEAEHIDILRTIVSDNITFSEQWLDDFEGTDCYIGCIPVDITSNPEKLNNIEVIKRYVSISDIIIGIRTHNGHIEKDGSIHRLKMPVLVIGYESIPGIEIAQQVAFARFLKKELANNPKMFFDLYYDWLKHCNDIKEIKSNWYKSLTRFIKRNIANGYSKSDILNKVESCYPEYRILGFNMAAFITRCTTKEGC